MEGICWRVLDRWLRRLGMVLEGRKKKQIEQVVRIQLALINIKRRKNKCLRKILAIVQINEYNRVYG